MNFLDKVKDLDINQDLDIPNEVQDFLDNIEKYNDDIIIELLRAIVGLSGERVIGVTSDNFTAEQEVQFAEAVIDICISVMESIEEDLETARKELAV